MEGSLAMLQETLSLTLDASPAISVAAVRAGLTLFTAAAGSVDGEPAEPDRAVFMTASITKLLNAVLALRLQEQGRLDLDADVSPLLQLEVRNPFFPDVPVTARQLLTHSSSLCDDEAAVNDAGDWKTMGADCPVTLEQYVTRRLLGPQGRRLWSQDQAPGQARYHYSNAGATLLGWVLEKASGKELPVLAREEVFERLGMSRSCYTLGEAKALPGAQLAAPHVAGRPGHYGLAELPAAGLRSTGADLARLLEAFTGDVNPLLSEGSLKEMLPGDFRRGLAWWGRDASYGNRAGGVWEHGGFMAGVRTHIYLYPERREGLVILTNGEADYGHIHAALRRLLREEGP